MFRFLFLLFLTSVSVFAGVKHSPDIEFSRPDGKPLKLDLFQPVFKVEKKGDLLRPAVICIHGGGWEGGNRKSLAKIARYFAERGYVAICVSYRLATATGNKWPAQLDDVQTAVRWLRHHAKKYQVDPERIAALGGSAGGHLAAMLGNVETRQHHVKILRPYSSRVNAVVSLAGPCDLTRDFRAIPYTGGRTVQDVVDQFLGKPQGGNAKLARQASPIFHISPDTPPHLLVHGTKDKVVPVDQARSYHKALKHAGIHCQYIEVPNAGHAIKNQAVIWLTMVRVRRFLDARLPAAEYIPEVR